MRKLSVFNFMTLDGYFEGSSKGDISWHRHGGEENGFASKMLQSGNTLLFGRITYEQMASFWPTPMALQHDPVLAAGMNNADKIVFSRTLTAPAWKNTRLIKTDIVDTVRKMKQTDGHDMTLLGSGSILTQFAGAGLFDEYEFMIDPVALGNGASIFRGLTAKLDLELVQAKTFKSGTILLQYRPLP
jgi:dihydrofolate reductase